MKQKRSEDEDEMLWHTLFSAIALVIILLTIIVLLLSDSRNRKTILYDGEFFEIYQKGDSVYIWNKDIDGGLVELDPEDPILQHFFESELIPKESTPMGGEP